MGEGKCVWGWGQAVDLGHFLVFLVVCSLMRDHSALDSW